MAETRTATCEWCGQAFVTPVRPGRAPRYCRRSHRQRAYEARRDVDTVDGPQAAAVDALAQAVQGGDVTTLVEAAIEVVATTGKPPPAWPGKDRPARGRPARSPGRAKPWKVVCHRTGTDPVDGDLYTAHTTRRAADTARRQLADIWQHHQHRDHAGQWAWSVVDDGDDRVDGVALDRDNARETARQLVVIHPGGPTATKTYHRQGANWRPDIAVIECITAGGHTTTLAARMRKTPNAYSTAAMAGTPLEDHPYAIDLIYDACNAGPNDLPPATIGRLAEQAGDLATQLLPPTDTWELDAVAVREWLQQRHTIQLRRLAAPE